MTISTKNKDFSLQEMAFNRFRNTNTYSPDIIVGNVITFTGTQFSNIVLSKFVGEQYMGNIDSEGSKLRSYFVNDLNAS
jgi:iron complex outermembrane receptor protein